MRIHLNESERGFSLVETIVATGILAVGLLSIAGGFAIGLTHMRGSSPSLIAREKAREAIESVHTARDTGDLSWDRIANVGNFSGVFVVGDQPMYKPGADGLVNTADDAAAGLEKLTEAGPDGVLGSGDDIVSPLNGFMRRIEVLDIVDANNVVNPNLRLVRVTVKYRIAAAWRTYQLTTYISKYS